MSKNKSILSIVIIGVFTSFIMLMSCKTSAITEDGPAHTKSSELKSLLDSVIADNNLPSIAAAVIAKEGVIELASAGVRKQGADVPVTNSDKYHIGSCTKAMTAALAAMYIDDGLLEWNSTILDIFSEMSSSIHEDYQEVTLYELLTHTSGLAANSINIWNYQDLGIIERRFKIITEVLGQPAPNPKGVFLYSNIGYTIAGTMLEKLTDKSWETLMKERIFDPLQMSTAGFGPPGIIGKINQPWGHIKSNPSDNGNPVQSDNPEAMGPAGTVHCNIADWGKFVSFQFLQNDTSLLSQVQRDKLLQVNKENYAPGWIIVDRPWANGKAYTHAGSNTMNYALVWVAPAIDRAYLVCTNAMSPNIHQICDGIIVELLEKN